ncbi:MAG: SH3 domain-containing protein [Anaerolineae bacterium]|nr:SH3 domain-containing protein [Anaerolineae bacterium]
MMRRWHLSLMLLVLVAGLLLPVRMGYAQDTPPVVVFIEDTRLRTASLLDQGPDGITQLEQVFKNLGATTRWLKLDEPLPENTQVVVLIRPLTALPTTLLARIWRHLARGGHLLLAMDPSGLPTVRGEGTVTTQTDAMNSGLGILLNLFYGIQLENTLLTEPWFANSTLTNQNTTFLTTTAETVVAHPVTAPLAQFSLPVQTWGARSIHVEPFGTSNYATPLIYTETAYGETNTRVFPQRNRDSDPLEFNVNADAQGRLFVGALAENTVLHSRVVVFGDSEMVQNGYGMALDLDGTPLYPGNQLLIARSAAWLLELPEDTWPTLGSNYTQLALDGQADEWGDVPTLFEDPADDAAANYDIQAIRAFRDDSFLYLTVETTGAPTHDTRLSLDLETTSDGVIDLTLLITPDQAIWSNQTETRVPIPDGQLVMGDGIEVRLPLRVVTEGAVISNICLADSRVAESMPPIDCAGETPGIIPVVNTEAPVEVYFPPGPRATVTTLQASVNIRTAPNSDAGVIDLAPHGRLFAVTGRTALGDWIQVSNGAYTGWMADFLVYLNSPLSNILIATE